METVDNIVNLKKRYDDLYSVTRRQQDEDQTFRDDTFAVSEIKPPHKVWRSGIGSRMVDAPAEQIVTSNPQVFFNILKGEKNKASKLSKEVNENWIEILKLSNPNAFKESVKNKLCRGESYIKVVHNDRWVTNPKGTNKDGLPVFDRSGLPVIFGVPDPMVIYGSPEEDDCGWIPNTGVPNRVIVWYKRQPEELIMKYPSYTNKANKEKDVEWVEYWDKDTMYYAADDEVLVHTRNPYGFVPFVRKYSGFGRRAPDGKLDSLIVSDIRFSRDLLREECIQHSNIRSVEDLFAHRPKLLMSEGNITRDMVKDLRFGTYDLPVLSNMPPNTKFINDAEPSVPMELLQSYSNTMSKLMQRNPFLAAGSPYAPSAREGDRSFTAAMRRYDSIVENTESEWATAISMGLRICKVMPTLKPDGLTEADLDTTFKVTVKLRAKDPIEEDRLITLGERLRNSDRPAIDLQTFHMKFMGMTQDESEEVQVKILADAVTFNNPMWVQAVGGIAVEEGSMEAVINKFGQVGQTPQTPRTTTERIQGEGQAGTPTEGTRGARQSPERYVRQ